MNLTRVAVTVGLACVAANLLMKNRRSAPAAADDGLEPFPSVDPGLPLRTRAITESGSWTGDLFQSTSPDGADARAPGLPDFARGA